MLSVTCYSDTWCDRSCLSPKISYYGSSGEANFSRCKLRVITANFNCNIFWQSQSQWDTLMWLCWHSSVLARGSGSGSTLWRVLFAISLYSSFTQFWFLKSSIFHVNFNTVVYSHWGIGKWIICSNPNSLWHSDHTLFSTGVKTLDSCTEQFWTNCSKPPTFTCCINVGSVNHYDVCYDKLDYQHIHGGTCSLNNLILLTPSQSVRLCKR